MKMALFTYPGVCYALCVLVGKTTKCHDCYKTPGIHSCWLLAYCARCHCHCRWWSLATAERVREQDPYAIAPWPLHSTSRTPQRGQCVGGVYLLPGTQRGTSKDLRAVTSETELKRHSNQPCVLPPNDPPPMPWPETNLTQWCPHRTRSSPCCVPMLKPSGSHQ